MYLKFLWKLQSKTIIILNCFASKSVLLWVFSFAGYCLCELYPLWRSFYSLHASMSNLENCSEIAGFRYLEWWRWRWPIGRELSRRYEGNFCRLRLPSALRLTLQRVCKLDFPQWGNHVWAARIFSLLLRILNWLFRGFWQRFWLNHINYWRRKK